MSVQSNKGLLLIMPNFHDFFFFSHPANVLSRLAKAKSFLLRQNGLATLQFCWVDFR
jgi:hypothetical protein